MSTSSSPAGSPRASKARGSCPVTGLARPECCCLACLRDQMRQAGQKAAGQWLSSNDDQPLAKENNR